MVGRRSGFTLIEVLVVLMLTSLISLALFSSFRTGIHSMQIAEEHINKMEDSRQLVNLVRRHLLDIEPAVLTGRHNVQISSFDGNEDRIRYVAPLSMSTYGEQYLIEIVSGLDGAQGLWIRFGRYATGLSEDEIFEDSEFLLVSEDLQVQFEYYSEANSEDDSGGWQQDWSGQASPPALVRMSVHEPEQSWPILSLRVNSG